jgi:hypothetical protein
MRRLNRRGFVGHALLLGGGMVVLRGVQARTYLTLEQAQALIFPGQALRPVPVELTSAQVKAIAAASRTRVRNPRINAWRTGGGDWFIADQVIGKHENIDIAVGLGADGKVRGIEILEYRETYGDEVRNPKWRAQFHGRDHGERLVLDEQIRNIAGATLSCRHITDGINRLTQTWYQVLRLL